MHVDARSIYRLQYDMYTGYMETYRCMWMQGLYIDSSMTCVQDIWRPIGACGCKVYI